MGNYVGWLLGLIICKLNNKDVIKNKKIKEQPKGYNKYAKYRYIRTKKN